MISINTVDSGAALKTVQILISWLLTKPADLYLHCFLMRIYPGSSGQGKKYITKQNGNECSAVAQSVEC